MMTRTWMLVDMREDPKTPNSSVLDVVETKRPSDERDGDSKLSKGANKDD